MARKAYVLYKTARIGIKKCFPLKKSEEYRFKENCLSFDRCSKIPTGYDKEQNQEVDGRIELKYLDLFDYLPKEDIEEFKKRLQRFALKNKHSMFSSFITTEDEERITNMGRYTDGKAFAKLHTVTISRDSFLKMYASEVTVSIHNLSASFLVVKYRFYITDLFNKKLNEVYCAEYEPYSDIARQYDVPWYKPWKFGRAMFTGDNGRTKACYLVMAELKWKSYKLIKKYFRTYFGNDNMFPPIFETYSTNIRASNDRNSQNFWESIGLEYNSDYSIKYNLCISWCRELGKNEGTILRAFCGGNYKNNDFMPKIAEYDISDFYAVYMVANTIRMIAERDVAKCNVKISKALRRKRMSKQLAVRSQVDQKLYYCNRFMNEFSGNTLESCDSNSLLNPLFRNSSMTKNSFESLPLWISETKNQIEILLNIFNKATDIQAAKVNMKIQWGMMIIAILSLMVAIIALTGFKIDASEFFNTIYIILRNRCLSQ